MPLSHKEFMDLFDRWAPTYDKTVYTDGHEGFERYGQVLARVADLASVSPGAAVADVGAGTGNLSQLLLQRGCRVTAVEPSTAMRKLAREKLGRRARIVDGHFLKLPLPDASQEAIVSTYAFHHLTDAQKAEAVPALLRALKPGGRIVIGDIAWASDEAREAFVAGLRQAGKWELVRETEEEYYTTVGVLTSIFASNGCAVYVERLTEWVWAVVASPTATLDTREQAPR